MNLPFKLYKTNFTVDFCGGVIVVLLLLAFKSLLREKKLIYIHKKFPGKLAKKFFCVCVSHCYCSEFSNFSSFQSFLTDFPSIWLFLAKKCTKMAFFDAVWRTAAKNQNKMSQAKMLKIRSYLVSWGTVYLIGN